jgi:hypothetical protein
MLPQDGMLHATFVIPKGFRCIDIRQLEFCAVSIAVIDQLALLEAAVVQQTVGGSN